MLWSTIVHVVYISQYIYNNVSECMCVNTRLSPSTLLSLLLSSSSFSSPSSCGYICGLDLESLDGLSAITLLF